MNTLLGNVKRAIDGTFHICNGRYAGRYLAEFSYRFNRRYSWPISSPAERMQAHIPRCYLTAS